jgi:hypothetical protein
MPKMKEKGEDVGGAVFIARYGGKSGIVFLKRGTIEGVVFRDNVKNNKVQKFNPVRFTRIRLYYNPCVNKKKSAVKRTGVG